MGILLSILKSYIQITVVGIFGIVDIFSKLIDYLHLELHSIRKRRC